MAIREEKVRQRIKAGYAKFVKRLQEAKVSDLNEADTSAIVGAVLQTLLGFDLLDDFNTAVTGSRTLRVLQVAGSLGRRGTRILAILTLPKHIDIRLPSGAPCPASEPIAGRGSSDPDAGLARV